MTLNLTQRQEAAVGEILALPEQGKRAASYGHTLLNRPPRSIRSIRRRYEGAAAKMGFSQPQVAAQWQDVKDMATLEAAARD